MKHQRHPNILVLLAALLLLALPRSGWAQFTYTTNNGAITITGDNIQQPSYVTIPSTINGYPVTTIGTNAFNDAINLRGLTIPDSVTSIDQAAFNFCSLLKNVTIGNSVTSIGDYAFGSCWDLTNLVIGSSVTSIGLLTFWRCFGLTNVTIPDSVTIIGNGAFAGCSGLTSVTIPNSVTNIGDGPFASCSGLTNIAVDAANPSYVIAGGVLFTKTMTKLVQFPAGLLIGTYAIPNGVTSIADGAFSGCSSLTSVTIPNSVTNFLYGPFAGCSGVTNIAVNAANPNYASMGNVLFNKTLSTLIEYPAGLAGSYAIPDSVTTIGDLAFEFCSGLTSVTIPDSVTDMGTDAFLYCTNLHQAFFQGNAPSVDGGPGNADTSVFFAETGTAYYVPGTTGWDTTFGGWPTAPWYQSRPQILSSDYGLGAGSNGFHFTISWATNTAVVVVASTNLLNWTPVSTNTLVNGTNVFWDSDWTHYPRRFYRVRSQ